MDDQILTANVVVGKFFEISPSGLLISPYARTEWQPDDENIYTSRYGFFCWCFPEPVLEHIVPHDHYYAVGIFAVLPHEALGQGTPVETSSDQLAWPKYVTMLPDGADCIVAHNFVCVARVLCLKKLIVSQQSVGRQLAARYRVQYQVRRGWPLFALSSDTYGVYDGSGTEKCLGDYHYLFVPHDSKARGYIAHHWQNMETRQLFIDIVSSVFRNHDSGTA